MQMQQAGVGDSAHSAPLLMQGVYCWQWFSNSDCQHLCLSRNMSICVPGFPREQCNPQVPLTDVTCDLKALMGNHRLGATM